MPAPLTRDETLSRTEARAALACGLAKVDSLAAEGVIASRTVAGRTRYSYADIVSAVADQFGVDAGHVVDARLERAGLT